MDNSEAEDKKILDNYTRSYIKGESKITDIEFDELVEQYEETHGIKYKPPKKNEESYYMGGLDKIKGKDAAKRINDWSKKYSGKWVISAKVDGVSGKYTVEHLENGKTKLKLTTKKEGEEGTDISRMIKYLNLPVPSYNIKIRGEIVLPLTAFNKYVLKEREKGSKKKLTSARNIVAGCINSKDSFDEQLASKLKFLAYTVISQKLTQTRQFQLIEKENFDVPYYEVTNDLSIKNLEGILEKIKLEENHESDGIVIASNHIYEIPTDRNPKHMIAFKVDTFLTTTITEIEWNASCYGTLVPLAHYDPVLIDGGNLTKAKAKNAKYILENKLGVGSIVEISRAGGCIPDIIRVITPGKTISKPNYKKSEYGLNESECEYVLLHPEKYDEVQIKRMVYFVKHMKIDNLGEGRIASLFDAGIKTIYQLLSAKAKDIASCDRLGEKSANTIKNNIMAKIKNADLANVMTSSLVFPQGFGDGKIKAIVTEYPNILEYTDAEKGTVTNILIKMGGFKKMAPIFEEYLPKFVEWLTEHSMIELAQPTQDESEEEYSDLSLKGEVIVFTGFRDNDGSLTKKINKKGGSVASGVSGKTTILLAKDISKLTGKALKAQNNSKTKIMTRDAFENKYNL